ncbi:hypothetical protein JQ628_25620 [Bradyrhizobium lablabi]|uniref:hypothetical protein n=1 Tax=Bradyrhizobium lablabi TaxID=722472 RepID=UPI001BAB4D50|nr:hypothetical protein [Bradyrhizobium lablabi]MBR1124926.1 hypothetical protein [Bradyrhizobium lablabi]
MSNITIKLAIASLLILAAPAASFARGGGGSVGGGHMGSAIGSAGGFRPNAGLIGAAEGTVTDPSGIGNASRVPQLPPPNISVPAIPQFK